MANQLWFTDYIAVGPPHYRMEVAMQDMSMSMRTLALIGKPVTRPTSANV